MRTTNFDKLYFQQLKQLEKYVQYCLRVLHRANIHPTPADFTLITIPRNNGSIAEAVMYPATAPVDNPLFFYGFKFDYNFKDLEHFINVTFCDNYEDLIK